jgi:DNA invertase Pin-like site-specific DNA recombinase
VTAALALVPDIEPGGPGSRIVAYGRQSKGKKMSIDRQLRLADIRAQQQDWAVIIQLRDKISASRLARKERDGWPRVFTLIRAGSVDVVWLYETSRADRKGSTWHAFLELCEDHGALIWVERSKRLYDVRKETDMNDLGMEGVANRRETDRAKERTRDAKDDARALGSLRTVLGGPPPVGYRQVTVDVDDEGNPEYEWAPDEDQVKLLRGVAARVLAGETLRAAFTATLKELGVAEVRTAPSPFWPEGRAVNEKMLRSALRRPVSAGIMPARGGGPMTDADGKEVVVVDDPPLDLRTWRRLRVEFGKRARRRPTADYPFGRLMRCWRCGNILTGGMIYYRKQPIPAYGCNNPHTIGGQVITPCGGTSVRAEQVHGLLEAAARRWAHNVPGVGADQAAIDARRAELVAALDRARNDVADLYEARRALPPARYRSLRADALREAAQVEAELDGLDKAEEDRPAVRPAVEWDGMTGPERCRLIEATFETPIVVGPVPRRGPGQSVTDRISLEPRTG